MVSGGLTSAARFGTRLAALRSMRKHSGRVAHSDATPGFRERGTYRVCRSSCFHPDGMRSKLSEKGALSVYGMGRFPVTLYKEQWLKLLGMSDEIRAFIAANDAQLKAKE